MFAFTHSDVLIEFGLITSLNVMITFLISLIFIPIVFSFLPPPSAKQVKHLDRKTLNRFLKRIDRWVHQYRKRVYAIVIVLVVISLYGMTKITTVGFVVDDLPKKDVIYTDLKFLKNISEACYLLKWLLIHENPAVLLIFRLCTRSTDFKR